MLRSLFKETLPKRAKRRRRGVAGLGTWTSLATAFNSKTRLDLKFALSRKETGLFGLAELKSADGFAALRDRATLECDTLVDEAVGRKRRRKMVEIFDQLSDTLCKVADLAEFVRIAHPRQDFALAAQESCLAVSGLVEKLNTHRGLYDALRDVVRRGDMTETTDMDERVSELFLFDFEQSGIHLAESERLRVVELNDRILQVGQEFMAGAASPRSVNIEALPENIRQHFAKEDGRIIVDGLNADSSSALAREAAYKIFLYPDGRQEDLLKRLLDSRHELARICGFPTYAHRAIKASTAESPELVRDFLSILNEELRDRARKNLDAMAEMKKLERMRSRDRTECSHPQDPMPWDTAYLTSRAKTTWLGASTNEFAPYFSVGACMEGLDILTQALYGVRLECAETLAGEVWSDDVRKLAVVEDGDGGSTLLGHIYCDLYEREGKPNQDCHFTIRGGRRLPDGTYQNPIVVLMLSLPSTKWSSPPCLLSPASVDNLFHEMGHALHSMLGRTQYQHVSGTRCSADLAEVPSVLMEYFASDPRVVRHFAKHFQTGEPMPENMLERLCASKNVFPASDLQIQVFYSMLDQVYHSREIGDSVTTTDILKDTQSKFCSLPYVENTAWQLRFSHLVGYGAKYYSYLISRAIASWIWQTYFQRDPLSRSAGERYRAGCLAHGGAKPPSKLVSDFLDKEASAINLAKSLVTEIDAREEIFETIKNSHALGH